MGVERGELNPAPGEVTRCMPGTVLAHPSPWRSHGAELGGPDPLQWGFVVEN